MKYYILWILFLLNLTAITSLEFSQFEISAAICWSDCVINSAKHKAGLIHTPSQHYFPNTKSLIIFLNLSWKIITFNALLYNVKWNVSQIPHFFPSIPPYCSHQGPGKATTSPALHISEASPIGGVTLPVWVWKPSHGVPKFFINTNQNNIFWHRCLLTCSCSQILWPSNDK